MSELEQKIRSMAKDGSFLCMLGGGCIDLNEIADRIAELERQNAALRNTLEEIRGWTPGVSQSRALIDAVLASADKTAAIVQPVCRTCKGSGVDGDCGPDGAPIDVQCGCCKGTGFAAPQTPAAQSDVSAEFRDERQVMSIYRGIKSLSHADKAFMEKWIADRAALAQAGKEGA